MTDVRQGISNRGARHRQEATDLPGLRLSAILASLRAQAHPQPIPSQDGGEKPGENMPAARRRVPSDMTLGDIIDRTAHAGFTFLMAFLALVAMPLPGLSFPFGSAIAFLGFQMIAGRSRPWLPKRLRRHVVTMSTLDWIGEKVTRWTAGVERLVKPRWVVLTRGPMWSLIGAALVFQGVGLALPIPIPLSNQLFIIPILLYAIGMLEDDGLLILIGHAATAVMAVLGVVFYEVVVRGLWHAYEWVVHLF